MNKNHFSYKLSKHKSQYFQLTAYYNNFCRRTKHLCKVIQVWIHLCKSELNTKFECKNRVLRQKLQPHLQVRIKLLKSILLRKHKHVKLNYMSQALLLGLPKMKPIMHFI